MMRTEMKLVLNEEQALRAIRSFREEGRSLNEIYVLAHDGERTADLSRLTDTNTIGIMEEGMATAFANLFRSRGDQIRAKMVSLGLSEQEADKYEQELEKGKIIVLTWYDEDTRTRDMARSRSWTKEPGTAAPAGMYHQIKK